MAALAVSRAEQRFGKAHMKDAAQPPPNALPGWSSAFQRYHLRRRRYTHRRSKPAIPPLVLHIPSSGWRWSRRNAVRSRLSDIRMGGAADAVAVSGLAGWRYTHSSAVGMIENRPGITDHPARAERPDARL